MDAMYALFLGLVGGIIVSFLIGWYLANMRTSPMTKEELDGAERIELVEPNESIVAE